MALKPLKVSEKGSSLTCADHDTNIDRLLDRGNHTGTQTCDTISDLEECVSDLDVIQDIQELLDKLQEQIEAIEESLSNDGEISDKLNALKRELLAKINEVKADVTDLQNRMEDAESDITSLSSSYKALKDLVEYYNTTQTTNLNAQITRINNINSQITTISNSISTLSTSLSNEVTARQTADNTLTTAINNEVTARQTADTTLQNNITTEVNDRRNAVTSLTNIVSTKAPLNSPQFTGDATFAGKVTISGACYTASPAVDEIGSRVPTTGWVNGILTPIKTDINKKSNIIDPTFTNDVYINRDLTVRRKTVLQGVVNFSDYAYINLVDSNNINGVANVGYVNHHKTNLQNQIDTVKNSISGNSYKTAKAFISFNGRNITQIYTSFNVSGITYNGKGDYTIYFTTSVSASFPSIVATCSRWPHDDRDWNDTRANPHVNVFAHQSSPHLNGSYVRISINGNEGDLEDRVNPEYISILVFANG